MYLDGFSTWSLAATFRAPQVLVETRIEMVKHRLPVAVVAPAEATP